MTRRDFIAIAEIIRDMGTDFNFADHQKIRQQTAIAFADGLARTNPRFNRELFIQAATGVVALNARKAVTSVPCGIPLFSGGRLLGYCNSEAQGAHNHTTTTGT